MCRSTDFDRRVEQGARRRGGGTRLKSSNPNTEGGEKTIRHTVTYLTLWSGKTSNFKWRFEMVAAVADIGGFSNRCRLGASGSWGGQLWRQRLGWAAAATTRWCYMTLDFVSDTSAFVFFVFCCFCRCFFLLIVCL